MTAFLFILIIGIWLAVTAVLVIGATMMSSRISQVEEGILPGNDVDTFTGGLPKTGRRAPTQPRPSIAN